MEFRAVRAESVIQASQENIFASYEHIALKIPGARKVVTHYFDAVVSNRPFSFCNFALNLKANPSELPKVYCELAKLTALHPTIRLVVPDSLDHDCTKEDFERCGFHLNFSLKIMACTQPLPNPSQNLKIIEAKTPDVRLQFCEFAFLQFFRYSDNTFRRLGALATSESDHRLFGIADESGLVASMMLVETEHSVGVYNLCVHSAKRGHGYGKNLVYLASQIADSRNTNLVLQTGPETERFYAKLKFEEFGELNSFTLQISE